MQAWREAIIPSLWKVREGSDSRFFLTTKDVLGQPGLHEMVTKATVAAEKENTQSPPQQRGR